MSDEDDDPFERLGDVDREGDPFERLDDAADGVTDADADATGTAERPDTEDADAESTATGGPVENDTMADPFADFDRGGVDGSAVDAAADPDARDDDPFAEMAGQEGDPFGAGDSVFERVDVGEVDADDVWSSLADDETADDDEPVIPDDSRYAEVSKHSFCEQCEHFAEPPDAHCTHETAEIIEYLDMERVRLLDCPVVAERRELED